ncbi:MAG: hypothetical protein QXH07_05395 [Thermoplasmata archaeon]
MTHYHFFGAAAVSAALVGILNSPSAQKDLVQYAVDTVHVLNGSIQQVIREMPNIAKHNYFSNVTNTTNNVTNSTSQPHGDK